MVFLTELDTDMLRDEGGRLGGEMRKVLRDPDGRADVLEFRLRVPPMVRSSVSSRLDLIL